MEPVIAGLDPKTNEPFIAAMDLIGCPMVTDDFVVSGTSTEQLYGMCESLWRPDLVREWDIQRAFIIFYILWILFVRNLMICLRQFHKLCSMQLIEMLLVAGELLYIYCKCLASCGGLSMSHCGSVQVNWSQQLTYL